MTEAPKLKRAPLKKAALNARKKTAEDKTVHCYRALRPIRVADPDGSGRSHMRVHGDFVPEVDTWPKPDTWIRNNFVESVWVNQSDIDAWQLRYEERISAEDAAEEERTAEERRIRELEEELQRLKDRKVLEDRQPVQPEGTKSEKISYSDENPGVKSMGAVRMKDGGPPRTAQVPQTRAPQIPENTSAARTSAAGPRRILRKKV